MKSYSQDELDFLVLFATDKKTFKKKVDNEVVFGLVDKAFNDTTSSFLREAVTVHLAGYEILTEKHGYDGKNEQESCEAKPENAFSKLDGKKNKKLSGHGTFNDYTIKKHEENMKENVRMVISGWVNGNLLFILRFPFTYKHFSDIMLKRLNGKIKSGKRTSIGFTYNAYKNCPDIEILHYRKNISDYKDWFTGPMYKFLKEKIDECSS